MFGESWKLGPGSDSFFRVYNRIKMERELAIPNGCANSLVYQLIWLLQRLFGVADLREVCMVNPCALRRLQKLLPTIGRFGLKISLV